MEQYLAGVELVSTLRSLHFTELYPIIITAKWYIKSWRQVRYRDIMIHGITKGLFI